MGGGSRVGGGGGIGWMECSFPNTRFREVREGDGCLRRMSCCFCLPAHQSCP
jgi:hypothetical protein